MNLCVVYIYMTIVAQWILMGRLHKIFCQKLKEIYILDRDVRAFLTLNRLVCGDDLA